MPSTPIHGYPYPDLTYGPNGPDQIAALANALDASVPTDWPRGIMTRANPTGPFTHTATSFAASNDVGTTQAYNFQAGRDYRIRCVIPGIATTYSSGNGVGLFAISRDSGTLQSAQFSCAPGASGAAIADKIIEYVGAIPAGSHTFALRFWCGSNVSQVVADSNGASISLTVEDLGPGS